MKISGWMKTDLVTISRETTVEDAINLLTEKRVGTLPVVEADGRLLGLVTMEKILREFLPEFFNLIMNVDFIEDYGALELPSSERQELMKKNISEIMEKKPISVSPECTVFSAISIMARHHMTDLLIVDRGILKGLVSTVDLGVAFLHWIKDNAEILSLETSSSQEEEL